MKYINYLLGTVSLIVVSGLLFTFFWEPNEESPRLPSPVETIIVEEGQKKGDKEAWLEQMHRTAPDVNWRRKDFEFRLNRVNNTQQESFTRENEISGKWEEIGSNNQAGRTLVAELDQLENVVYVASDGGQIWKSSFGSENWESLTDHFRIPAIHFIRNIHDGETSRLLVGSGVWSTPGIMYSDDEGNTWQQATGLENIADWGFIRRTVMKNDPYEGIYIASQEWDYENWQAMSSIYVSYDLGESFQLLQTFTHGVSQLDIWTNRYSNGDVFVLDVNNLYLLTTEGELELKGQITTSEPARSNLIGVDFDGNNTLYSMLYNNGNSQFYSSDDLGENWDVKGSLDFGPFMTGSFAASPVTPDLLYFGGVNAYTSSDGGDSWDLINNWADYYGDPEHKLHADIPSFNSFINEGDSEILFINTDGGIYLSLDDAESVLNLSLNNLRISQYYSSYTCRFAPENTHAGAQDQGYQFSDEGNTNDVLNYDQVISGDYGHIVSGDEGASVWMVYPGFAMYAPDANNNGGLRFWDFVGSNYQWMPELMADPDDPASVYVAGGTTTTGAHQIHLSYNGGQINYEQMSFDFSNGSNANISAMAYSPMNSEYRYVMTSNLDFYYSTDSGESWTRTEGFETPGSHYFYGADIEVAHQTEGLVFVGGSGYSSPAVYVSTDNGLTFSNFSEGLPETLVHDMALSTNDELLFAATEVGAYVCRVDDGIWYSLNDDDLPDQNFWAVDFVDTLRVARFASYGRGVWDYDLEPDVEADFTASTEVVEQWETVDFTDLSQYDPISWEWIFEGSEPLTSSEQNPSVFYHEPGLHDVTLIVHNETSSDTMIKIDYIEVLPSTGIDPNDFNEKLSVYPNPVLDFVNISSKHEIQQIDVIDLSGHQLKSVEVRNKNTRINLKDLPDGIYLLRIETQYGIVSKKLLKNK